MNGNFNTMRSERRSFIRQVKKAMKNRKIVPENTAFNVIKFELINKGWILETGYNNVVENLGKWKVTTSSALKLVNDVFNITLLPKNEGIEISRLEVFDEFQQRGYAGKFLYCLLQFLIQHGINDIFLIPLPAGLPGTGSSTELDTPQLERFYSKRGFKKLPEDDYWKLDITTFLNSFQNEGNDNELLNRNYTPVVPAVFIGNSFKRNYQLAPIKMKIYKRA